MKLAIISSAMVSNSPFGRLDARYWIEIAEEMRLQHVANNDHAAIKKIVLYHEAMTKMGIRELVQRARNNFAEYVLKEKQ